MLRKVLFLALAAVAGALLTTSKARAWGCYHSGYTHVGYGGVEHYGHTTAAGPYGSYSGGHASAYGYGGGSYHAGYGHSEGYGGGGSYHYGASSSGGYGYGGYHSSSVYGGGYSSGVYRGW